VTWSTQAKDLVKALPILLGLALAAAVWVGCITMLRHSSCDKMDAERISHLEPGHDTPGPGSIFVIGVGPGPPKSEILQYLEAEEAMRRAGC
jgi:hypothetical protein